MESSIETWGLDDAYWAYRKLLIITITRDVKMVEESGLLGLYLLGRPIRKVEITGTMVSKAIMTTKAGLGDGLKVTFLVDDMSDIIECTKFLNGTESLDSFAQLGDTLVVRGVLSYYQMKLVIHVQSVSAVTDPSREIYHALKAMTMYKSTYQPLLVTRDTCNCYGPDALNIRLLFCSCTIKKDSIDPQGDVRKFILSKLLQLEDSQSDKIRLLTITTNDAIISEDLKTGLLTHLRNNSVADINVDQYFGLLMNLLCEDFFICHGAVKWPEEDILSRPVLLECSAESTGVYTLLTVDRFYDRIVNLCKAEKGFRPQIDPATEIKELNSKAPFVPMFKWKLYIDKIRVYGAGIARREAAPCMMMTT